MQGYWSRLATKVDPNGDGALHWPFYSLDQERNITLDEALAVDAKLSAANCDFRDQLSP